MEIRSRVHEQQPYHSKRFDEYFGGLKVLILDIETTGLYANSSKVILGGVLSPEDHNLWVRQYFLEKNDMESDLLQEYCTILSEADVLITYNGNGFDLPFLKRRIKQNGLSIDLDHCQTFDLYRSLHIYSKLRDVLPNLKQKTIEAYLGLSTDRKDEISGQESVLLYQEYIQDGRPEVREKILLHNHDDLMGLAAILQIIEKLDLHKILFYEGFTIAQGEKKVYVQECAINQKSLSIKAITRNLPIDYYSFEIGYQAIHRAENRFMTVDIPLQEERGCKILDLETIPIDFSSLEDLPSFHQGYMILKEGNEIHYIEAIRVIKLMIQEIMKVF